MWQFSILFGKTPRLREGFPMMFDSHWPWLGFPRSFPPPVYHGACTPAELLSRPRQLACTSVLLNMAIILYESSQPAQPACLWPYWLMGAENQQTLHQSFGYIDDPYWTGWVNPQSWCVTHNDKICVPPIIFNLSLSLLVPCPLLTFFLFSFQCYQCPSAF